MVVRRLDIISDPKALKTKSKHNKLVGNMIAKRSVLSERY